jgi:hypothetical protein
MANFQTQIENIAGKTATSTGSDLTAYRSMLDDFLKQSARVLLDTLPIEVLERDAIQIQIINVGLDVTDKKIIKVLRDGFGCVMVPLEFKSRLVEGSGSIFEPSKKSPVFYLEGQSSGGAKLFIRPITTTQEPGYVDYNSYPSPVYTDSAITNFPDRAEYAVVIGAAIRLLQHKLNKLLHSDEDVELVQVANQELATVQNMYNEDLIRLGGTPATTQGAPVGAV